MPAQPELQMIVPHGTQPASAAPAPPHAAPHDSVALPRKHADPTSQTTGPPSGSGGTGGREDDHGQIHRAHEAYRLVVVNDGVHGRFRSPPWMTRIPRGKLFARLRVGGSGRAPSNVIWMTIQPSRPASQP